MRDWGRQKYSLFRAVKKNDVKELKHILNARLNTLFVELDVNERQPQVIQRL